ncbi:MAG TPA: AtpZ/AtpI family protein [Phenylobacterium sp.]|jgi:ATP synthase protein I|nr:AtpZ/AtpI family protein [Phenylobacterium sp.]
MPHPSDPPVDDPPEEALKSLDERLGTAEAAQARKMSGDTHAAIAQGYRFVGEVVGGVLGGVGLGWLLDHYAHTQPWGMIGGLLIGSGVSIFTAMTTAARTSRLELERQAPAPSVPHDEDED